MRRPVRSPIIALAAIMMVSVASAHVVVSPRESRSGAYEKYVVRVPTEGTVATTSIELEIPAETTFIAVGAPVGYTYELKKSGDRVVGVVWSMKIDPGEFAEFALMARNSKEGKRLTWKAVQHFADGTSTQWTGVAGDKHPASTTMLIAGK